MGVSIRLAEANGRGVDPLDPVPGVPKYVSADPGVSPPAENLELRGVDFLMVGLRPRIVDGTAISDGVIASTHGLLEFSSAEVVLLALLSFLLSRILFDSPLTCFALASPDELEPELDSVTVLEATLEVSIVSPRFGDLPLPDIASSVHPAGVGGTGPNVDEFAPK